LTSELPVVDCSLFSLSQRDERCAGADPVLLGFVVEFSLCVAGPWEGAGAETGGLDRICLSSFTETRPSSVLSSNCACPMPFPPCPAGDSTGNESATSFSVPPWVGHAASEFSLVRFLAGSELVLPSKVPKNWYVFECHEHLDRIMAGHTLFMPISGSVEALKSFNLVSRRPMSRSLSGSSGNKSSLPAWKHHPSKALQNNCNAGANNIPQTIPPSS